MSDEIEGNTPAEQDDFETLFNDGPQATVEASALGGTITVRTTTGDARYIPVDGPTRLMDVISRSGLAIGGNVQYWMDGVQLATSENPVIPVGASVTVVGSVKGG